MAVIELTVPDIGDVTDAAVIELLVKPGDAIKAEQAPPQPRAEAGESPPRPRAGGGSVHRRGGGGESRKTARAERPGAEGAHLPTGGVARGGSPSSMWTALRLAWL